MEQYNHLIQVFNQKDIMTGLIKDIFGFGLSDEDKKVLSAISESGLTTMRVVGRGTLIVDAKEVTNTRKFKEYSKKARRIVAQS